MNLLARDSVFVEVALAVMREPWVNVRLLIQTPAVWGPAAGAGALLLWAWRQDRRDEPPVRWAQVTEALAGAVCLALLAWLFRGGQFPWTEGDWREEWIFFTAWAQALHAGNLPYYLGTAMQGTERYLANLQTPMMPYVVALAWMSVNAFVLLHMALVYGAGFLGVVALRRELSLGFFPWTLFLLLFTLNGHIVSHLSVGHLPWIAYFLVPWVLVSAVRISRGDRSWRTVTMCAAAFAGMILVGGWHVFVWSLLFMTFACLLPLARVRLLIWIGVITALLAAVRLVPAVATFGTGANTFISGYPSFASLLASLAGEPVRDARLDPWELEAYVGYAGLFLLCLGAIPFRHAGRRYLNGLLVPTCVLVVLSLGNVYGDTLFRLPGLVSERVTTRLIILPILWLGLAGVVRLDSWWRDARMSWPVAVPVLLGAWFFALQLILRAQVWRPHVGTTEALPLEVLKAGPVEPLYLWAFWCGAAVSMVSAIVVAWLVATRASTYSPSGTGPTRASRY